MNSIPASQLVNVVPGVLGAGGNPLALNGVLFTNNTAVPIGTLLSFPTLQAVQDFFGPSSTEAALAAVYFNGFEGATVLPGLIYFKQFPTAAVGAYARGGSMAAVTLAQLQALTGSLVTNVNGVSSTSLAIDLSTATSFSNAAALIQTGIQGGTPTSTATVTYDAQRAGFVIHSPTTGIASTMGAVSGSLAAGLKLTAGAGAVLSQGADTGVPSVAIAALVAQTQNWATTMTTFEPVTADKVLWAHAVSAEGQRYVYVGWDTATGPTAGVDPTSFAALTADLNGRVAIWGPADKAAWFCGATASINFNETNGRLDYAFKSGADITPDVTDASIAANLEANGYNFYGSYATANDLFNNFQRGLISGDWNWADAYVDQIKLNSDFQLALMSLLSAVKSIPYVTRGYDLLRAALMDPIQRHLRFGSIVAGVTLSNAQRAAITVAAGTSEAAGVIQTRGWYLQILDADPIVRANRGSPPMTFWYTDGGSIQRIQLASIDVQ